MGSVRFGSGRGVAAPHRKNTAACETVEMPAPEEVVLCMSQHLGPPCVPTVKVGDAVAVGDIVGDSDKPLSAPVHASISGTVSAIRDVMMPGGQKTTAVVISSDGEMRLSERVCPPTVNTFEEFISAVRSSGLVGLGGAGFPTHIKLNPKNLDEVDTIIINAAECEPYITADYRECMENSWEIVSGVKTLMEFLDTKQVIIAIEANKPAAITELSKIAATVSTPERQVLVKQLPARYPQGAEKVLIAACTGRQVPPGKLPADVGCVVMNVTSVGVLAEYLKTGMPLVTKRVTVDGGAIARPQNVRVRLGTSIDDVIAFCGGLRYQPEKLLLGGPMMGTALMDETLPVLKQTNAVLALTADDLGGGEPTDCIRCGRCVRACPMKLLPTELVGAYQVRDTEKLNKLSVMTCMECGCCSYSCPAHRPLVQQIRLAKGLVRAAK